jgi:hypothetical protein
MDTARLFAAALGLALAAAPAAAGAAIVDLAGTYVGAWNNLTFSSTGAARFEIAVAGPTASITFDMDGNVFGGFDPPPIAMNGTVSGDDLLIDALALPIFGDVVGSIAGATGAFSFTLSNVPGGFITSVTAMGSIASGVIDLDYSVLFPGPSGPTNPALGTLTATLIPEPGTGLLVASGLLGVALRRAKRAA